MNGAVIRENFHRKVLRRNHQALDTLVIDGLGLIHGHCRADIAVINGHLITYEIKSDEDSLHRIKEQAKAYSAVFDKATVIVGQRHMKKINKLVPDWWGITAAVEGHRGAVHFKAVRPATWNKSSDDFSVAQLLWKEEVEAELKKRGVEKQFLRQKRSVLYRALIEILDPRELRYVVRERLKNRTTWRCLARLSQCDG